MTATGTLANTNPLRYRGYYYDTETGFYYLQSRYYDPTTCRFLNADGYVSTGQGITGLNMFAYCGNSPTINIDFFGFLYTTVSNDGSTGTYSSASQLSILITKVVITTHARIAQHENALPQEGMLGSYAELKKLTIGTGYQVHHLIEYRFHDANDGNSILNRYSYREAPSVILSRETHQMITNRARRKFTYGGTNYREKDSDTVISFFRSEYTKMGKNDWVEYIDLCYR